MVNHSVIFSHIMSLLICLLFGTLDFFPHWRREECLLIIVAEAIVWLSNFFYIIAVQDSWTKKSNHLTSKITLFLIHTSIVWNDGLLFSLAEKRIFAHDGLRSKGVVE